MQKLGFTLAEVLITLSIIGVVAAMTLPALTANIQKAQTGPALAKAINILENANRMALTEYETRSLKTIASNYMSILDGYVSGAAKSPYEYISKDGILYSVGGDFTSGTSNLEKYLNSGYHVTIDVNGVKKPNSGGEDVFSVIVDYGGIVIPSGGQEMYRYNGNTVKLDCRDNPTSDCAGNIVDNGWKVIY